MTCIIHVLITYTIIYVNYIQGTTNPVTFLVARMASWVECYWLGHLYKLYTRHNKSSYFPCSPHG